jgi:hypothetical protein
VPRRSLVPAAVHVVAVLVGLTVALTVAGPAPTSVAAPERDSSLGSSGDGRDRDDDADGDRSPGDRTWRWVLYQDFTTGKVRKYRVDADGQLAEVLPEEGVAVEFLTVYLDQTVPLRERCERIRPFLAAGSGLPTTHDPFFRHPPASAVTGESMRAMSERLENAGDTVRTVFVGTDIGDYRVVLSPADEDEGVLADPDVVDGDAWEVHSVLPPASWLRTAAPDGHHG